MARVEAITCAQQKAARILTDGQFFELEQGECVVVLHCTLGGDGCFFQPEIKDLSIARRLERRNPQSSPCHPTTGALRYDIVLFGPKED